MSSQANKMKRTSFLSDNCKAMAIYETLGKFNDSYGAWIGTEGTHPWSQGLPLTAPLEKFGGPSLPSSVDITMEDRFYPKAGGHPKLRAAIANLYNDHYKTKVEPENIMVFPGGRGGIFNLLNLLKKDIQIRIATVEWPAYLDIMTQTGTDFKVIQSDKDNGFHPKNSAYFDRDGLNWKTQVMAVISNPSNPTGHVRRAWELRELVEMAERDKNGILLDEAYEFFTSEGSVSGIQYVKDLNNSNVFITGACTKGLQCPGIRVGWVVASKSNIKVLANFSTFGMGGVSHPSQLYAVKLMEPARLERARDAVMRHFNFQRERYGKAFRDMGITVHTGTGGFYHWCELPEGMNSVEFNERLFKRGAAILPADDCDMARPHSRDPSYVGPYERFFRFSFGPLKLESFVDDVRLLREVFEQYKVDVSEQDKAAVASKKA